MNQFTLFPNDITKDADTQLRQTNQFVQDLNSQLNQTGSAVLINYTEPQSASNTTTTNTSFVNIPNFTQNITVNNVNCNLIFNLLLQGVGQIRIVSNGQPLDVIPFSSTGFLPLNVSKFYVLKKGSNTFSLQWLASTGTVTKGNTTATPGSNTFQLISHS